MLDCLTARRRPALESDAHETQRRRPQHKKTRGPRPTRLANQALVALPLSGDQRELSDRLVAFDHHVRVDDLRPGDLIAIAYPPGTADTGHVMLVDAAPVPADGPPVADGLTAWRIEVIDATATPHGSDDSRAGPPPRTGVGRGAVRLYAEAGGEPGGYTWSTRARSPLHRATARPLALGRPI
jgi:hypothetical protein